MHEIGFDSNVCLRGRYLGIVQEDAGTEILVPGSARQCPAILAIDLEPRHRPRTQAKAVTGEIRLFRPQRLIQPSCFLLIAHVDRCQKGRCGSTLETRDKREVRGHPLLERNRIVPRRVELVAWMRQRILGRIAHCLANDLAVRYELR